MEEAVSVQGAASRRKEALIERDHPKSWHIAVALHSFQRSVAWPAAGGRRRQAHALAAD